MNKRATRRRWSAPGNTLIITEPAIIRPMHGRAFGEPPELLDISAGITWERREDEDAGHWFTTEVGVFTVIVIPPAASGDRWASIIVASGYGEVASFTGSWRELAQKKAIGWLADHLSACLTAVQEAIDDA